MGEYFCNICKFYDDDVNNFGFTPVWIFSFFVSDYDYLLLFVLFQTEKQQFHCDECGICRWESFFIQCYSGDSFVVVWWLFCWHFISVCYRVGGRENFFHCKKCGKRKKKQQSFLMLSFRLTQSCVVDSWNYPLLAFRILLCGWSAQQPSLRWEFNASSLSHLLRGMCVKAKTLSRTSENFQQNVSRF